MFVWYGSFTRVHSCESMLYVSHLQALAVIRYLKRSSLYLFRQQIAQPSSLRSLKLIPITRLPLPHHANALHHLSSHSYCPSPRECDAPHPHNPITLLLLVGPSSLCSSTKQHISGLWTAFSTIAHAGRHCIEFPSSGWSPTLHGIPVPDVARDHHNPKRITTTLEL